jgi:hypothetical protein
MTGVRSCATSFALGVTSPSSFSNPDVMSAADRPAAAMAYRESLPRSSSV